MAQGNAKMAPGRCVLVIAGTDPTGGAGVVRDVETIANCESRAAVAITAVTVQDDRRVSNVCFQKAANVTAQMEAALLTKPIGAIKIGMVGQGSTAKGIAKILNSYRDIPVVLDPVLSATSGGRLATNALIPAIKSKLLPLTYLLTPNLQELGLLTGHPQSPTSLEAVKQAKKLIEKYPDLRILIKGGHNIDNECDDILVTSNKEVHFKAERLHQNMRGTGCALSSAIAAKLTQGHNLVSAIRQAKIYVHRKLLACNAL